MSVTESALGAFAPFFKFHPGEQLVNGCAADAENLGGSSFVATYSLQNSNKMPSLHLFERKESFVGRRLVAGLGADSVW